MNCVSDRRSLELRHTQKYVRCKPRIVERQIVVATTLALWQQPPAIQRRLLRRQRPAHAPRSDHCLRHLAVALSVRPALACLLINVPCFTLSAADTTPPAVTASALVLPHNNVRAITLSVCVRACVCVCECVYACVCECVCVCVCVRE